MPFLDPHVQQHARCLDGYDYELCEWDKLPKEPVVSLWMLTYQHASFIRQALDSVLSQAVDFPYEICLGEDGSSDGTREICLEYQKRHPDKIRLFLRDRSNPARTRYKVPFMHNGWDTLYACRGKYIAVLEGDDYWTHDGKLQRQVDALNQDPALSLVWHDTAVLKCDAVEFPDQICWKGQPRIGLSEVVTGWHIMTCSMVFRKSMALPMPDWIRNFSMGDYPLQIILATRGPLLHIPGLWSTYRKHSGGVSRLSTAWACFSEIISLFEIIMRQVSENERAVLSGWVMHYYHKVLWNHARRQKPLDYALTLCRAQGFFIRRFRYLQARKNHITFGEHLLFLRLCWVRAKFSFREIRSDSGG